MRPPNPVYDTIFFARKVLDKYFALRAAHKALQAELDQPDAPETTVEPIADTRLEGIDLHNTSVLTTEAQHRPIADWFATKKIVVTFNHKAIDTSGFYDEAALEVGQGLDLYRPLLDQIRYAQGRGLPRSTSLWTSAVRGRPAITAFSASSTSFHSSPRASTRRSNATSV